MFLINSPLNIELENNELSSGTRINKESLYLVTLFERIAFLLRLDFTESFLLNKFTVFTENALKVIKFNSTSFSCSKNELVSRM